MKKADGFFVLFDVAMGDSHCLKNSIEKCYKQGK